MFAIPQNLESGIGVFRLYYLIIEKLPLVVDKHPVLLILPYLRLTPFNFCTYSHGFMLRSPLVMSSLIFRVLYFFTSLSLRFFQKFPFSSKMVTKPKSRMNSYNFACNRLFNQDSIYVFGILLAPTNSKTFAAAILNLNSLKHTIDLVHSTLHFCFRNLCNVFNCSFFSDAKI